MNPFLKPSAEPVSPPKIKLIFLISLTVGAMIGGGIFNLPQNMAIHAGAAAIVIGWLITGTGIFTLCYVYRTLALRKPALNNGVFVYARAGLGEFIGFNSAWGYWISACLGNVGYLMAVFSALGYFFPPFNQGGTPIAIFCASLMIWLTHAFILQGIKGAIWLNFIITIAKVLPLFLFISLTFLAFRIDTFQLNFWGNLSSTSLFAQVKNTMLITVWMFIGIEGASVYSARAEHRGDIGKAILASFVITLLLLVSVSLLPLGVVSQAELANFTNIPMAEVLARIIGPWGAFIIILGLLFSVGGAFLSWTLLAAEALFSPANEGLMPECLSRENDEGVPENALWSTNGLVQFFLIIALFLKTSYLALISLSTSMILMPYLFSAFYAIKLAIQGEGYEKNNDLQYRDGVIGAIAISYCFWLLYAAGFKYLLLSALLYFPGVIFYIIAKYQHGKRIFQPVEWIILLIIFLLTVVAGCLLKNGELIL